jgi:hypothetical protein
MELQQHGPDLSAACAGDTQSLFTTAAGQRSAAAARLEPRTALKKYNSCAASDAQPMLKRRHMIKGEQDALRVLVQDQDKMGGFR